MIRTKRFGEHDLPLPKQNRKGDAGYDLSSPYPAIILPKSSITIPIGFGFVLPYGWVGLVQDRSGMAANSGITTMGGVIDSNYRGEVSVTLFNTSNTSYRIDPEDRIAQLVVLPCLHEPLTEIEVMPTSNRGNNRHGSSGR